MGLSKKDKKVITLFYNKSFKFKIFNVNVFIVFHNDVVDVRKRKDLK